jgi:PBCV-specific basic adaptor domain
MKLLAIKALDCLLALLMLFAAMSAEADTYVNGYFKKDGTYVEGHFKTTPHDTNWGAYSTDGNSNPYTGGDGQRARDYSSEANNYGSGQIIYTGPRGGQYYINDNGKKVYVPKR